MYKLIPGTFHPIEFSNGLVLEGTAHPEEVPRSKTEVKELRPNLSFYNIGKRAVSTSLSLVRFDCLLEENLATLERQDSESIRIVSRLAERAAKLSGVTTLLAHPAKIRRGGSENTIDNAEFVAIPEATEHDRSNTRIDIYRDFSKITKILNFSPEEMYLLDENGKEAQIPRPESRKILEPIYEYSDFGEGYIIGKTGAVPIKKSKPIGLQGLPEENEIDNRTLMLVHPEGLIEAFRLGAPSKLIGKMVIASQILRSPNGRQRNVFKELSFISESALRNFACKVKI